uniref:dTMP kinase n=1 Tax=Fagus sylvatica TaxID=28930 RepID=A0A2N9I5I0_FAGSY
MAIENGESRGALIVLEGLDRSGKSLQCGRLVRWLEGLGHSAELWRFPDRNTNVGQMISSYLNNNSQLDDHTIHLLFSANRWEKRSLMETKLKTGTTLIVDRYSYSGVAFSSAKGLAIEWCKAPEIGLLAPDLVVYLDIQPETDSGLLTPPYPSENRKLQREEDMEVRDMSSSSFRGKFPNAIRSSMMPPGREAAYSDSVCNAISGGRHLAACHCLE